MTFENRQCIIIFERKTKIIFTKILRRNIIMKTANIMEFDKDLFKVEELYERAGIIVEEFYGMKPAEVDPEIVTDYILDLRKYLAEADVSPSQIVLHDDGTVELLFYPIIAEEFTERELNIIGYELEIEFAFLDKLKVSIPENIISDYKPELTQAEMYYLFIAGLSENTKDFKNNILGEIPTPSNENAIEITTAQ